MSTFVSTAVTIGGQELVVRDMRPTDTAEFLRLHQAVFGPGADEGWYGWKYCEGRGHGVGVWQGHRLVAHCGGVPRRLRHGGKSVEGLQIADVMVAAEWRGILTRTGPFFHVCSQFYQSRLGPGHTFQLGFGFPNARHFRLAVKTGLSWDAGEIRELHWSCAAGRVPNPRGVLWACKPIAADEGTLPATLDRLATHMVDQLRGAGVVVGERSYRYLRWRFMQRPDRKYQLMALRQVWSKTIVGVCVVGMTEPGASSWRWLDWIGPLEAMATACEALKRHARQNGVPTMTMWASPFVETVLSKTDVAFADPVACLGIPKASDIGDAIPRSESWWVTSGDTDFL